MPQFGSGIIPSGAIGNELAAITRRAFIPSLVVQIYKAHPVLSLLLGNSQRAAGGVSSVTVPTQGASFVAYSWAGFDGVFPQPTDLTAIQNAEFNLKLGVVPIPFLGMEALVQSTEVVIPRLRAVMADAKAVMTQQIASSLYTNNSALPLQVDSFAQAFDDGTNVSSYGGINRNANPFWKSTLKTGAGAISTRIGLATKISNLTLLAGGEAPDFGVMAFGDWTTLMEDFMAAEQFRTTPGSRYGVDDSVNAGFRCLTVLNVPIFPDPFLPQGTSYLFNSKYVGMYISEDAPFAFSGFHSTIPNFQIANIGVLIVAFDVLCTKPVSGMQITGITGNAF
jgi:hypothetical protein